MPYTLQNKKIWVAGHNGMVGSAICRALLNHNCDIITANKADLDLRDQHA
ncbi:MAG: NAD-dependent epimerase/dehydratase family protein, partial [Pseudomonadota bacterium]|nr:NAD-dependent epimerase/dehydratase family protein [Pseudomonadota bacterium]